MSHKVHPKVFRIKEVTDWDSRGFYKKNFPEYLKEDFEIREFLRKKLKNMGVEKIEIERFPRKLNIIITSVRPGLIIGRGGGGVGELKKELERILSKNRADKKELGIEIREIKDPWLSASLASEWIAQQIEKRVHHRRVLKRALDKITAHKAVQGARVEVAGRLNGVMISRTEWLKKGRLPLQTLRAVIDYAKARAYCTYGVVGVKVWIYKGDKFE
ncbi:MAG: 30S ribosomal protein S3 [Candidatus Pacebacteria bacterium]|nr:30S ribosomal protein S3 [Candidatus Paceibacterota bacterium]